MSDPCVVNRVEWEAHDWRYAYAEPVTVNGILGQQDVFYCSRCLERAERLRPLPRSQW